MSIIIGTEINAALKNLFDQRITTVIVATIDPELSPHTAPFNYIVAPDLKHLRLAMARDHQTFRNISLHGMASVAVLDEGDIAVSITGPARVVRENMENDYNMAIVEIAIEAVKKDNTPEQFVYQGVRSRHKIEPNLLVAKKIFQELLFFAATPDGTSLG